MKSFLQLLSYLNCLKLWFNGLNIITVPFYVLESKDVIKCMHSKNEIPVRIKYGKINVIIRLDNQIYFSRCINLIQMRRGVPCL